MKNNYVEYVLGFLFNPDGTKVIVILKNRPEWQRGKLNGVGGKIEPNESPIEAMVREFQEETGLIITTWERFASIEGNNYIVYCYRAFSHKIEKVKTTTDEAIYKFTVDLLYDKPTLPNIKWLVYLALDKESYQTVIKYN